MVIAERDEGSRFYIVREGELAVSQGGREVNRLYRADFFGEQALLSSAPRAATVRAVTDVQVRQRAPSSVTPDAHPPFAAALGG